MPAPKERNINARGQVKSMNDDDIYARFQESTTLITCIGGGGEGGGVSSWFGFDSKVYRTKGYDLNRNYPFLFAM